MHLRIAFSILALFAVFHSAIAHIPNEANTNWRTRWQTTLELRPGPHTLEAIAAHSSGLFTTNSSVTFTNNAVDQTTLSYLTEGQLSYRVWKNSSGQTNRIQMFSWDAKGRLLKLSELDASENGFNWSAVYDALGRRLQTTTIIVTNGVALSDQPKIIQSHFDPLHEFLEVGVRVEGRTTWKIYGPDLDGHYGGMNGTGGLDGTVDDVGVFHPAISDARGNLHGARNSYSGSVVWNASRPTGYDGVPEYRPVALVNSADLSAASAWRGRWADLSGLYWLGARYYDPVAGRFISCDPLGHDADPSLYAFANGDPINYFDPDGRLASPARQNPSVYVNSAPADLPGGDLASSLFGWNHQWISTSAGDSVGMGNLQGIPGGNGQTSPDLPFSPTQLASHHDRIPSEQLLTVAQIFFVRKLFSRSKP